MFFQYLVHDFGAFEKRITATCYLLSIICIYYNTIRSTRKISMEFFSETTCCVKQLYLIASVF